METKYIATARVFKALADENRVKILEMLIDGERFAGSLLEELEVSQPTLSHHMKLLCDSGLVNSRKDGRWIYYSISPEGRDKAFDMLADLTLKTEEKASVVESKKAAKKKDIVLL